MSPTAPITSGTSTINRTLLHTQQFGNHGSVQRPRNGHGGGGSGGGGGGNTTGIRGLAMAPGESPPPTYEHVVVHDISLRHGFLFHVLISFFISFTFSQFSNKKNEQQFKLFPFRCVVNIECFFILLFHF